MQASYSQAPAPARARAEFRAHWLALLGSSIGAGCGLGLYTPVSSMFFRALEQEFHWSKAASAASLVAYPVTAFALPLIGRLLDRFGAPAVIFVSALCLSSCLVALSLMTGALWQFYAIFLALTVLGAGTGPISYTRVVAEDFQNARGLALALSLVGSAATAAVAPLFISRAISADGWRHAYRILSLITLGGGVFGVLLIRRPVARGQLDGSANAVGCSLEEALRTRAFWHLGFALMLVSIASIGFFSQLQSIAVEKGLTASMAALMISLLALSVIPSRLLVGWALDLVDPRIAGAAALMLGAAGALTVFLAPHAAVWLIALGVVLIGASIGAEFDLMSFFCARFFGLRNYALIYGLLMGFFYIGFAGGGIGYGLVHDHSGSYLGALAGAALFLAIASGLLLALPSRSVTSGPPSEVALGSN